MSDYADALAVKISSTVLKEQDTLFDEPLPEFWLILNEKFVPPDSLPRYYKDELAVLARKTPADLRAIHHIKVAFPTCRVKE